MLELYQAEGCPYSASVREKLTDLGVSYVIHNPRLASGEVRNERTHGELTDLGGQDQIPHFVDTNRQETLYESDDIVEYVVKHYG
ncbi:glutathione S-transferase N-terminal domain-containing protein [Natrinema salifodinae]|uniref:Glutathione S-transferase, N-terminal domain n=1 Tax=Natrinema salifodinae TaxID=1202768 RepID=A0A1I0MGI1_9EURY|nr:glutathione S-transferase N-terminal domain-containing protein [Natrinema salifodinae]SEV87412.1 Glutathione S-transferase, N-terminal domain [Natrinema salifodinae]